MNDDPFYDQSVRPGSTEGSAQAAAGSTAGSTAGGPVEYAEGTAKRVALAGIGAIAEVCDTAEQRFDRLVDRGQRVQQQWQERADQIRTQNIGARGRMRDAFRTVMDAFFDTINVPSKTDVDSINLKLSVLGRKLDDLQTGEMRAATAQPPPASTPADGTTGDLAT